LTAAFRKNKSLELLFLHGVSEEFSTVILNVIALASRPCKLRKLGIIGRYSLATSRAIHDIVTSEPPLLELKELILSSWKFHYEILQPIALGLSHRRKKPNKIGTPISYQRPTTSLSNLQGDFDAGISTKYKLV
jgi:hypothetical protein